MPKRISKPRTNKRSHAAANLSDDLPVLSSPSSSASSSSCSSSPTFASHTSLPSPSSSSSMLDNFPTTPTDVLLDATNTSSKMETVSTRRRSLVPPKNYTFAPNVTPVSYPTDPAFNHPSSSRLPEGDSDVEIPDFDSGAPDEDDCDLDDYSGGEATPTGDSFHASGPSTLATGTADPSSSSSKFKCKGKAKAGKSKENKQGEDRPSKKQRSNGRRVSDDHIPRPPNAFMLYRQMFVRQRHVPGSIETSHNSLSRIVGDHWHDLPRHEKLKFQRAAAIAKEEHKQRWPEYRFSPRHDPEKKKKRQAARQAALQVKKQKEKEKKEAAQAERRRLEQEQLQDEMRLQMEQQNAMYASMSGSMGYGTDMHAQASSSSQAMVTPIDEYDAGLLARQRQHPQLSLPPNQRPEDHFVQAQPQQQGQVQYSQEPMRPFHFGHRRSSSVPPALDVYPAFAFSFDPNTQLQGGNSFIVQQQPRGDNALQLGQHSNQAQPDPFNFANPGVVDIHHATAFPQLQHHSHANPHSVHPSGQQGSGGNGGIAIPSLPAGFNGFRPSWFGAQPPASSASTSQTADDAQGRPLQVQVSNTLVACPPTSSSDHAVGFSSFPSQYNPALASLEPSSAISSIDPSQPLEAQASEPANAPPALAPRLSTFGLAYLGLGLGARAAHAQQIYQSGRRASSTQPSLQLQLDAGFFTAAGSCYDASEFEGTVNEWGGGALGATGQEGGVGADGFVGAVAGNFTNPFAPASATASSSESNRNEISGAVRGQQRGTWYDGESVDPMTPVYPPGMNPNAHHTHSLSQGDFNPNFSFGAASATGSDPRDPPSPRSAPISGESFVPPIAHIQGQNQTTFGQHAHYGGAVAGEGQYAVPRQAGDFTLVQPVPLRTTAAVISEGPHAQYYQHQQPGYPNESPSSIPVPTPASAGSCVGSPTDTVDGIDMGVQSHSQPHYHAQSHTHSQAQHFSQALGTYQAPPQHVYGHGHGYVNGGSQLQEASGALQGLGQAQTQGESRFSFSDYMQGSPFVAASAVAN